MMIITNDVDEIFQRAQKQLRNAHDKLERVQRHSEGKRVACQRTVDRLQLEYDEMSHERRDNDRQVDELRGESGEIEQKVCASLQNIGNPT
jgi:kinetochore protein Nuf2